MLLQYIISTLSGEKDSYLIGLGLVLTRIECLYLKFNAQIESGLVLILAFY